MDTEQLFFYLEIAGTVIGLVYLWLEYHASIYLWIAGIIMPAIYIFIFYHSGLYADCVFNVYYLLAAVYGLVLWAKNTKPKKVITADEIDGGIISQTIGNGITSIFDSKKSILSNVTLVFVLLFLLIAIALDNLTDSTVPWWNALNSSLSIVGMWMLAKKYVEQWWLWIAADIVCAGLYIHTELYFTAALYALYTIIAVFGYRKWRKMMNTVAVIQWTK